MKPLANPIRLNNVEFARQFTARALKFAKESESFQDQVTVDHERYNESLDRSLEILLETNEERFQSPRGRGCLRLCAGDVISACAGPPMGAIIAKEAMAHTLDPDLRTRFLDQRLNAHEPSSPSPQTQNWFDEVLKAAGHKNIGLYSVEEGSIGSTNGRDVLFRENLNVPEVVAKAVLAHEIAHIENQDFLVGFASHMFDPRCPGVDKSEFNQLRRESEFGADKRMVDILLNLGVEMGPVFEHWSGFEGGHTHPSGMARVEAMSEYLRELGHPVPEFEPRTPKEGELVTP